MAYIEISLCILLGITFLNSSVTKLRHPQDFVLTVFDYQALSLPLARTYGWALPSLEFLLASLLLTGTLVFAAAIGIMLLLTGFIVAASINAMRDQRRFEAKGQHTSGRSLVLEDSLLLIAALIVAILASSERALTPWSILRTFAPDSNGFWPLFINLALTGCITALLRFLNSIQKEQG